MPAKPAVRRVHRTDLSTLQPVEERDDGTIVADARLTRCGVFQYIQPDGSVRRELRRKQDVCDSGSLRTLVGRPVTNNHPPGLLTAKDARDWGIGAQAGDVTIDEDHVRSRVSVWDASTIGAMRAGKVEVSCGYTCDALETPGEDPVYGQYDAIQTNIQYNHIAIVDKGRAGPTAKVRMDGWMVRADWDEGQHPRAPNGEFGESSGGGGGGRAAAEAKDKHAFALTEAAPGKNRGTGNPAADRDAHAAAAKAHREAAAAWTAAGDRRAGDINRNNAEFHEAQATAHAAVAARAAAPAPARARAPAGRSDPSTLQKSAETYSRAAKAIPTKRTHTAAAGAHAAAAQALRDVGRMQEADKHASLAAKHQAAATKAKRRDGTGLADPASACNPRSMAKRKTPTARVEVVVRADEGAVGSSDPDPDDEADRNARGANDAPAAAKPNISRETAEDDDADMEGGGDDEPETEMDAYDAMYGDDGCLTDAARSRMAAGNFAVPGKERLPIHTADAVKGSMKRFGATEFDDADEKHAAFNRIVGRAKDFGVNTTSFQRAHGAKLDRAAGPRSDTSMTTEEIKKLQAKATERKNQRDEARTRADAAEAKVKELEGKLAKAEGDLANANKELETAKKGHLDSAAIDKLVAERADLVATAQRYGTPGVTSAMAPVEIKRAVIKHLDKDDVPADKHPEYVEALYQGAVKRHKAHADATEAGANALAAARGTGGANAPTVVTPPAPGAGSELPSEAEVAARTRNDSNNAWARPGNAAALRGGY